MLSPLLAAFLALFSVAVDNDFIRLSKGEKKPIFIRSFSPKVHSLFHVNDTRAPAKASSELRSPRCRLARKIVITVHVALTSLGNLDKKRHRVSGVTAEKDEDNV